MRRIGQLAAFLLAAFSIPVYSFKKEKEISSCLESEPGWFESIFGVRGGCNEQVLAQRGEMGGFSGFGGDNFGEGFGGGGKKDSKLALLMAKMRKKLMVKTPHHGVRPPPPIYTIPMIPVEFPKTNANPPSYDGYYQPPPSPPPPGLPPSPCNHPEHQIPNQIPNKNPPYPSEFKSQFPNDMLHGMQMQPQSQYPNGLPYQIPSQNTMEYPQQTSLIYDGLNNNNGQFDLAQQMALQTEGITPYYHPHPGIYVPRNSLFFQQFRQ